MWSYLYFGLRFSTLSSPSTVISHYFASQTFYIFILLILPHFCLSVSTHMLCQSTWQNNKYPKPEAGAQWTSECPYSSFERLSLAYSHHTTGRVLKSERRGMTKPGGLHLRESNDSSVPFLSDIPERVFRAALGTFITELFFSKHSRVAQWWQYS